MSEMELLKRIDALENKVKELEDMLNLISDIQKSERLHTAIEKKKKTYAFSSLLNTLSNDESIDTVSQQQEINEMINEQQQAEERISESLSRTHFDIDNNADYGNLFSYEIIRWNNSDICEITGYLGFENENDTELIIPDTIDGYKVVSIGKCAFAKCNFEKIFLPKYLERIQEKAFENCNKLKHINLPNGLTYLVDYCFCFCKSLERINLPESLSSLGHACFWGTGLVSVNIPQKIRVIPSTCFDSCQNLKTVRLPEGLEEIGYSAFVGTRISEIIIPSSITKLKLSSFVSSIKSLSLNNPLSIVVLGNQTEIDSNNILYSNKSLITLYCNQGSRAVQDARKAGIKVKPLSQFSRM